MVDRIDDTVQFTLNGVPQGGPFDISGLGDKTVFPFADSWFHAGPVAAISGGTQGFAEGLTSGYTALDNSGGGSSDDGGGGNSGGGGDGRSANAILVNQPPNLTIGADTIVGHEADPGPPVYLSWHSYGTPSVGDSDVVQANVNSNGNFRATVDVDHAGTVGTMFVGNAGALTAAWSATPSAGASSGGNDTTSSVVPGGGGSSTGGDGDGSSANAIIVNQPPNLMVGADTIVGNETDSTQPVYLSWHSYGTPSVGDSDVVQANVNPNGNFRATVDVDHAGMSGTMYVGNFGALSAAWSATPAGATTDDSIVSGATISGQSQGSQSISFVAPETSGSTTTGDAVLVDQPANLSSGVQDIFGAESDPSQPLLLDWQTYGTPALDDSEWVQATVHGSGRFFASVNIDQPGVPSTMFYRVGSGPVIAAWSGTPS